MDAIPGSVENNSGTIAGVFETAGESFADGSAIELVSSSTGNRPGLFFWRDGRDPTVASHVQREGRFYVPINAGSTIWAATTLPTGIVDRGPSANLFAETRQLVETYIGASSAEAALATAWNATTWFADILPNPPALFVHGPDMSFAIKLFWLFSCIGRHPLIVTEIGRAALCSLMVFATHITHQSGANVPSVSRTVLRVELQRPGSSRIQRRSSRSCEPKAMFVGTAARTLNEPGLHLYLPPARGDLPPLDAATRFQIKERFQPWYLWHRLSHLPKVRQSLFAGGGLASPIGEVGRLLQSCTQDGGQLKLRWRRCFGCRSRTHALNGIGIRLRRALKCSGHECIPPKSQPA